MIEIASFLRGDDNNFVPIEAVRGPLEDHRYIEGALELKINGIPIINKEMWDYIDELWAYIGDMFEDLRTTGEAQTYFPDQPIRFSVHRVEARFVVATVDLGDVTRSSHIDEVELVDALRSAGVHFFDVMMDLVPANHDLYANVQRRFVS